MPKKPPSDRTRAKGVPLTHLTPGTVGAPSDYQKKRNEPNSTPATTQNCKTNPISARQFCETNPICPRSGSAEDEKNETNPISRVLRSANSQKCETNPIYEPRTTNYEPKLLNEPNFRRGGPVEDEKCETNPIFPTPTIRRTNLCETNPIYRTIYNLQYTIYGPAAHPTCGN